MRKSGRGRRSSSATSGAPRWPSTTRSSRTRRSPPEGPRPREPPPCRRGRTVFPGGGPMATEREKLYDLIKDIKIAMLTTRRPDGRLVSRAMATQKRAPGADLWFVTSEETHKVEELEDEPNVNLAYYKDRTREWISISGIATVSRDPEIIRNLWAPDWKT